MSEIAISTLVNVFSTDGTTVRARRIAKILKNYYEIFFITRTNSSDKLCRINDIDVISVNPENTKLWNLKLVLPISKTKFRIVYCSNDWFGFITYYLLSKFLNYKIIFEAHSILSHESKEMGINGIKLKSREILEKFVIKNADQVIALSKNTFDYYQIFNPKIELIPVFVDENLFKKNASSISNNSHNNSKKLLGIIGPFNTDFNKNFLNYIYNNISYLDPRIDIVAIGKFDTYISSDRIRYTGYIDSIQDYVDTLSSLDAVIIPSDTATYGPLNKIIEPMSCSLPVFTTPKGMIGLYYVENGKDILVFEINCLIENINRLIFDDELMNKIGSNARTVVETYYSTKVNNDKLLNIISNLL